MDTKVLHGAIALIKSGNKVIGRMRSIRIQENIRRDEVKGLGTILPHEKPATAWNGTLSCDFMEVSLKQTGIPGAIKRNIGNVRSQAFAGVASFEDQVVLDSEGVTIEIYKKVVDLIDIATGHIRPKAVPAYIVTRCLIEGDSLDIGESSLSGRSQQFSYLDPVQEI